MKKQIKVKALLYVERNDDEILVFEDFDKVKKEYYYRPLGGTVEFGERTIDTVAREILEETGEEAIIGDLFYISENFFVYSGDPRHEIVYIYKGSFKTDKLLHQDEFYIMESNGVQVKCKWINKNLFKNGTLRLEPEGLTEQL